MSKTELAFLWPGLCNLDYYEGREREKHVQERIWASPERKTLLFYNNLYQILIFTLSFLSKRHIKVFLFEFMFFLNMEWVDITLNIMKVDGTFHWVLANSSFVYIRFTMSELSTVNIHTILFFLPELQNLSAGFYLRSNFRHWVSIEY